MSEKLMICNQIDNCGLTACLHHSPHVVLGHCAGSRCDMRQDETTCIPVSQGKAYAVFIVKKSLFEITDCGDGFPDKLAFQLWHGRPALDGDTALAKFYKSGLPEGAYDLTPMKGSTFTRAYFWLEDGGGVVKITGRYW